MKEEFKAILKGLTTKEEKKTFLLEGNTAEDLGLFLDFLIAKELLFIVDWKGEVTKGDVLKFINQRLKKFNIDFKFDDSKINKVEISNLEIGEFVVKQMKEYQKAVAKHNFVIADFYTHSDNYLITVVKKSSLTKLKKITIEDCFFRKFGDTRNKKVLYAIDCGKCGKPGGNWEIPINEEPPSEGQCYFCGENLFNEDGTPIYPMEKIPVP
ncbi:MAG: DUF6630 family protein [Weeksellaceae bacterium]